MRALVAVTVAATLVACHPNEGTNGPSFKTRCDWVRSAPDDPIVYPGQPGASHLHDFFGSQFTGAVITPAILDATGTTCNIVEDKAAYWAPALSRNGVKVDPTHISAYYLNDSGQSDVQPYPDGLRVIAGDASATSPQDPEITRWVCAGHGDNAGQAPLDLPDDPCPTGTELGVNVHFPDCWNGTQLDSANHKSHLAYSNTASHLCPPTHPVRVPELFMVAHYPTQGGGTVSLASGGKHSAHMDFVNGWEPTELERLVDDCLNSGVRCR